LTTHTNIQTGKRKGMKGTKINQKNMYDRGVIMSLMNMLRNGNISRVCESDKFPLSEYLLKGSVSLSSRPHKARNSDNIGLGKVDGSIFIELHKGDLTSATEIWMEE